MPDRLRASKHKLVGTKRTLRALREDAVSVCYLALDADARIIEPLRVLCGGKNLEIVNVESMKQLGRYCGIDVGAATAAILK